MTIISWRDDYSVRHEIIDAEHRGLFDLTNEFDDKCLHGDAMGEGVTVLSRLVAYAEEHFRHEESLMELAGYPRLERHRELHNQLFSTIFDFKQRFESRALALDGAARRLLKDWLLEHILKEDMDFRDFRMRCEKQEEQNEKTDADAAKDR